MNAKNAKGQTPLSVACSMGSPSIVKLLLAHPTIDKDTKDKGLNATPHRRLRLEQNKLTMLVFMRVKTASVR